MRIFFTLSFLLSSFIQSSNSSYLIVPNATYLDPGASLYLDPSIWTGYVTWSNGTRQEIFHQGTHLAYEGECVAHLGSPKGISHTKTYVVDDSPPIIKSSLSSDGHYTVQVYDLDSGADKLWVNGLPKSINHRGKHTGQLELKPGLNLLKLVAEDKAGIKSLSTEAVYHTDSWLKSNQAAENAFQLYLTQEFFRQLSFSFNNSKSIRTLIQSGLNMAKPSVDAGNSLVVDSEGSIAGNWIRYKIKAYLLSADVGAPKAEFELRNNSLLSKVSLSSVGTRKGANALLRVNPILILMGNEFNFGYHYVNIVFGKVALDLNLTSIDDLSVKITDQDFDIEIKALASEGSHSYFFSFVPNLFSDWFSGIAKPIVESLKKNVLENLVQGSERWLKLGFNSVLDQLSKRIFDSTQINFEISKWDLLFDPYKMTLALDTAFKSLSKIFHYQCKQSNLDKIISRNLNGTINAYVAPVLINQILHTLWEKEFFNRNITLPADNLGVEDLQISFNFNLPPITVNTCQGRKELQIESAEVILDIQAKFLGVSKRFTAKATASALLEPQTRNSEISLEITHIQTALIDVIKIIEGDSEDELLFETFFDKFIIPAAKKTNLRFSLGTITLPYKDLGAVSVNSIEEGLSISLTPNL